MKTQIMVLIMFLISSIASAQPREATEAEQRQYDIDRVVHGVCKSIFLTVDIYNHREALKLRVKNEPLLQYKINELNPQVSWYWKSAEDGKKEYKRLSGKKWKDKNCDDYDENDHMLEM